MVGIVVLGEIGGGFPTPPKTPFSSAQSGSLSRTAGEQMDIVVVSTHLDYLEAQK